MKNWTGVALCVGLFAGCTSSEDRIFFDGQFYTAKLRKVERQLDQFVVTVKPVSKSLEGGKLYFGSPADEARTKWRELAALRQLPNILRKLKK